MIRRFLCWLGFHKLRYLVHYDSTAGFGNDKLFFTTLCDHCNFKEIEEEEV